MFYTVIIGHFMAACFACLGLINCTLCISAADRSAGNVGFFPVLAAAAWPLAIAVIVEILLQILVQLEQLNLNAENEPQPDRVPPPVNEKPQPKAEAGENVYFPVREKPAETPVTQTTPEPPEVEPAEVEAAVKEKPAAQPTNVAPDNGLRFFKVD